ncbi:hypothetical protein ES703_38378 [subsurface metagenome]
MLGAIDQAGKAALGEFGAGIVDGVLHHFVIAAQHQHVAAVHPWAQLQLADADVARRQAVGEQRLGRGFDVQHQALQHVVEQADLFVGIVHRVIEKEIGDAAQRLYPAGDGAVGEGGLQFIKQVLGSFCSLRTHDSILES